MAKNPIPNKKAPAATGAPVGTARSAAVAGKNSNLPPAFVAAQNRGTGGPTNLRKVAKK